MEGKDGMRGETRVFVLQYKETGFFFQSGKGGKKMGVADSLQKMALTITGMPWQFPHTLRAQPEGSLWPTGHYHTSHKKRPEYRALFSLDVLVTENSITVSQTACWGMRGHPEENETPKLTAANLQAHARGHPRSPGHQLTCQLVTD